MVKLLSILKGIIMNNSIRHQLVSTESIGKTMESLDLDVMAKNILNSLSDNDVEYLRSLKKDDLITLHHSLGRSIRNNEKLWYYKWTPELNDQCVDHSPYHPDAVSMTVIEKIHDLVCQ